MTPPTATAAAPAPTERPIFAATTRSRPRALKLAGRGGAALVGLWLVAFVLGAFGFSDVAGIPLPQVGGSSNAGEAARKPSPNPSDTAARSRVRLTSRHAVTGAIGHTSRHGPTAGIRPQYGSGGPQPQTSGRPSSTSTRTGTGGGTRADGSASSGSTQTTSGATPTASPAPATTTPSQSQSSHSQASPPGSSSSAPGSRSQASTAPGREQSAASPSPGSGRAEHAPPKG